MRNIELRLIISILFFTVFCVCRAQSFNELIVYSKDGNAYELNIESGATLTYADNTFSIESTGNLLIELPLDDVSHWETVTIEGGSSDTKVNKDFNISFRGNFLHVDSHVGALPIVLYDATGVRLQNYIDDSATIPFQRLPVGIYILTIGNQSIKLCKR